MKQPLVIPTRTRLAHAIKQCAYTTRGARWSPRVWWLITLAWAGYYDEYDTDIATPILNLVHALRAVGFTALAQRALEGEFDANENEVLAWMREHNAVTDK